MNLEESVALSCIVDSNITANQVIAESMTDKGGIYE